MRLRRRAAGCGAILSRSIAGRGHRHGPRDPCGKSHPGDPRYGAQPRRYERAGLQGAGGDDRRAGNCRRINATRLARDESPAPTAPTAEKAGKDAAAGKDEAEVASGAKGQAAPADSGAQPARSADAATIEVHITDEAGAAVDGAKLLVSTWELDGKHDYPTKTYTADSQGVVIVGAAAPGEDIADVAG